MLASVCQKVQEILSSFGLLDLSFCLFQTNLRADFKLFIEQTKNQSYELILNSKVILPKPKINSKNLNRWELELNSK